MGKIVDIGCLALVACTGYALGSWVEPAFSAGSKTLVLIALALTPVLSSLLGFRLSQSFHSSLLGICGIGLATGLLYDRLHWGLPGLFVAFAMLWVGVAVWAWTVDRIHRVEE